MATFGQTGDSASSSTSSADADLVNKAADAESTPATDGTLDNVTARLWVSAGSMVARAVIYDASGNLLSTGDEVTISSNVEAEAILPFTGANRIALTAGTKYAYGVIWDDPGAANVTWSRQGTAAASWKNSITYPTPGNPLGSGTVSGPVDMYVSYTPNAILFDAASNSGYQAAASTYNWAHTCTGSNRYLKVGVSMLSLAQTVTGITYNSVAMIFLGAQNSVTGACRVEMWGLVAPATGSNTIEVTMSGAIASAACATSFTGVHQTSPTEGFNSAQATNVGAADATVNVTTVATNDWVVDQVATDDTAITVGALQTSRNNVTGAGGSGADSTEPATTAGAYTMSWTNVGALATWSIAAIALRDINASTLGGSGTAMSYMTPNTKFWGS